MFIDYSHNTREYLGSTEIATTEYDEFFRFWEIL